MSNEPKLTRCLDVLEMLPVGDKPIRIKTKMTTEEARALASQIGSVYVLAGISYDDRGNSSIRLEPDRGIALVLDGEKINRGGISVVKNQAEEQKGRDFRVADGT